MELYLFIGLYWKLYTIFQLNQYLIKVLPLVQLLCSLHLSTHAFPRISSILSGIAGSSSVTFVFPDALAAISMLAVFTQSTTISLRASVAHSKFPVAFNK